jgi:hypothetical protein
MQENLNHPDDAAVSALLRQARVAPALPPRFEQDVWRRIENAAAPAKPAFWLDALAGLILRPRFALTAAAVLLVTGVWAGTLDGQKAARHEAQMNYLASVAPHSAR